MIILELIHLEQIKVTNDLWLMNKGYGAAANVPERLVEGDGLATATVQYIHLIRYRHLYS